MAITVRELVTTWGFDIDSKQLSLADKAVAGFKKNVALGAAAVGILGASIGALAVRQAGRFEQFNVAFETMLGSTERAKKLMEEITTFARKTPFELTGLVENSKRLLAFGFEADKLIDTLDTLGNITAGVGKEKMPQLILALGQVRAATKLRGQELRQFTEAGVPLIEELAKVMGKEEKEIAKLVSKGEVSFDLTLAALNNLTKKGGRFANLMVKQSQTLFGIFSNIKDFIQILGVDIGNILLPSVKKLAGGFLAFLEANRELIKTKAVKFIRDMSQLFNALFRTIGGLVRLIDNLTSSVGGLLGILKGIGIALISPLLVLEDIMAFFEGRESITGRLVEMVNKLLPKLGKTITDILSKLARRFIASFKPVQGFLRNTAEQLAIIFQLIKGIVNVSKNLFKGPAAAFFKSFGVVQKQNEKFLKNIGSGAAGVGGIGATALVGTLNQARILLADLNAAAGGQAGILAGLNPATAPAGGRGNVGGIVLNLNQNITGSGNPAETGAAAASAAETALKGVLRDANRDFSNSIER
jgi:tape measure domain-containing protein